MTLSANARSSKSSGQYHSVKGTVVEAVGNATGLESWQTSGRDEHASGEAEITAAQAQNYAEGTMDRAQGKLDAVAGAITGDKQQQASGNMRHDKGQAQQEMNKPDF
ncbi:mismatched base pair and cruciform DNA recognition protein [Vararia minispora EC-137]|uniref:Mismatched base pair and cruciform DNA recognition protein n=1 Tax=Vararia minispora EC-137 TaxID=1314806 RepID=A0ACB8QF13_9AGAM|nr:mismatched base pair and cruciform DNA recognition protein [Vararia minispora EC-137]